MAERIDGHCHVSNRWYEPADTLLFQMDRCGVARAVLVQLLGGTDNAAMREAARANPDRLAWVAGIDPSNENALRCVEEAVEQGAAGLRIRATARSPGDDPLAIWKKVRDAGLAVSLAGPVASFVDGALDEIAEALPDLPLVMEHLGGLARPDVGDRDQALQAVIDLARHPNLAVKLPGLGQLAPRLPSPDASDVPVDLAGVTPLLETILRAYGPGRLMWGSDFPPVAAREGYANALNWTKAFVAERHPDAVDSIFGLNAARIWFAR